ncbi:hypothetical protein L7F22_017947 [Adiantum nelumboides]|nr:hypothetical protein [Adiantum nelumboides]
MAGHWLLKTEPEEWSWEHQQANDGVSHWDGIRNAQAQKHLRSMELGDLCFFYHSGAKAKEIVGIARVCKTFYPDPSDASSKHGMVDIKAVSKLCEPLTLSRLKQEDGLLNFIMFCQPRLSVVPISNAEWNLICELAGHLEPPLLLDGNRKFRVIVNDQTLELGDGEGRVTDTLRMCTTEPKHSSADHNADVRARVSDQISQGCDKTRDSPLLELGRISSQPSPMVRRQPKKRKTQMAATTVKVDGPVTPSEALQPPCVVAGSILVECNYLCKTELDELSVAVEAAEEDYTCGPFDSTIKVKSAPDLKRVYSRRSRKQGEVEALSVNAEVNDSKGTACAD